MLRTLGFLLKFINKEMAHFTVKLNVGNVFYGVFNRKTTHFKILLAVNYPSAILRKFIIVITIQIPDT